jgi:alcohol dehydrogenase class IV
MNGFDKGLELPYSRHAQPVSDALALHGVGLFGDGLAAVLDDGDLTDDPAPMEQAVAGLLTVQYGRPVRGEETLSVVHAFGHGLRETGLQQGVGHAVVVPHVLEAMFSSVDARRESIARALGVGGRSDAAAAVVARVTEIRDALGLPSRLRDLDVSESDLAAAADVTATDALLANGPVGYDPSREVVESVFEAAW